MVKAIEIFTLILLILMCLAFSTGVFNKTIVRIIIVPDKKQAEFVKKDLEERGIQAEIR